MYVHINYQNYLHVVLFSKVLFHTKIFDILNNHSLLLNYFWNRNIYTLSCRFNYANIANYLLLKAIWHFWFSFKRRKTRSSRSEVFCKNDVLRNFPKFIGKHLCQSLIFNKVADQACNFIKNETLAQVFSCEFCKISKNTFSYRIPPVVAAEKIFYLTRENSVNMNDYQTTSNLEKLLPWEAAFQMSLTIGSSVNSRKNSCNTSMVESN